MAFAVRAYSDITSLPLLLRFRLQATQFTAWQYEGGLTLDRNCRVLNFVFSRRFRRKSRLLQWLVFFSSDQRVTSTFCALMHIYQLLPYVLSTSFSTHPKRLTWDKKRPPFYIFRHYVTYRKLRKKISKKNSEFFFSIFSFLRAFVVSSCRKSGFRVFLSLRYGADLGRSRLVFCWFYLYRQIFT